MTLHPILALVLALMAIGWSVYSIYHVLEALRNLRAGAVVPASLVGPVLLLMPSLFTEIGNAHRLKVLRAPPMTVLLFAVILVFGGLR